VKVAAVATTREEVASVQLRIGLIDM